LNNPFVVNRAGATGKAKISMRPAGKIGQHHFRFLVSLQADCCYFCSWRNADFMGWRDAVSSE
jgi:hypothetical protein